MGRRVSYNGEGVELSRDSILREAIKLFSEKGYRATSLEDVAEMLGVTRPSLYYYYKSKQDILLKAHLEAADAIFNALEEINERPLPVKEKFVKIIENHVNVVAKNAKLIGIFYEEEKELQKVNDRVKGLMEKRAQYSNLLETLYREGVAKGVFRNVEPKIAIFSILGACNWVYRWYKEDGELSPEAIAKVMAKFITSGFVK